MTDHATEHDDDTTAGFRPAGFQPNRAQRRAMGYTRKRKVYVIDFAEHEDPSLHGLEVKARGLPLGSLLELIGLAGVVGMGDGKVDTAALDTEALGALEGLFSGFAEALVAWNLEEDVLGPDGEPTGDKVPVPATFDGLKTQDAEFGLSIIGAWMSAVQGVSGPLDRPSSGGAPSLEASLPMAPVSASPTS